jgi:hypothetical protein
VPRFKFNQHIDVAVQMKVLPQNRSKEREFAYVVTTAELRDLSFFKCDSM